MTDSDRRPIAPFGRRQGQIERCWQHGPYCSLVVDDSSAVVPLAGQFYMLQGVERWGAGSEGRPFLGRALSFARAEQHDGGVRLHFLLEAVGPGTTSLVEQTAGNDVWISGPFGNGFLHDPARPSILVGGGIGLAPIIALNEEILRTGSTLGASDVLVGMRSAAHAAAADDYAIEHRLTTEDGSAGERGYVTVPLAERIAELQDDSGSLTPIVYSCGPPAMLEAVRALCAAAAVDCQLAMESTMACGYGACYGCVVPTDDGFLRLCVDGPVVAGEKLETADPHAQPKVTT